MTSMKDILPQFYPPNLDDIWENAVIVFDTNILLNLYMYPENQLADFFDAITLIQDRIWIPHQVAYEYQKIRITKINQQHNAYLNIENHLKSLKKQARSLVKDYEQHPDSDLQIKALLNPVISSLQKTLNEIKIKQQQKPELISSDEDPIRERIENIYDGRIGLPYTLSRMQEIEQEGIKRDKENIPPGFNDRGTGDLILWLQTIDYAKEQEIPVILVTDDVKSDWVVKNEPCIELRDEMYRYAGVECWIYDLKQFLKEGKRRQILIVEDETIETSSEVAKREADYGFSALKDDNFRHIEALSSEINEINKLGVSLASQSTFEHINEAHRNSLKTLADIADKFDLRASASALGLANSANETLASLSAFEHINEAHRNSLKTLADIADKFDVRASASALGLARETIASQLAFERIGELNKNRFTEISNMIDKSAFASASASVLNFANSASVFSESLIAIERFAELNRNRLDDVTNIIDKSSLRASLPNLHIGDSNNILDEDLSGDDE